MGVIKAYERFKNCKYIKRVHPKKLGRCEVDGSAVSYMRLKTTEGRLLLTQLKKQAKVDVSATIQGPIARLAQWGGTSWAFTPPTMPEDLVENITTLKLSTSQEPSLNLETDTLSTDSTNTQPPSSSRNQSSTEPISSSSTQRPLPLTPADSYPELNAARDVTWPILGKVMNKMLDNSYKKSEDFIHYDGPPTTQKAFAHEKRQRVAAKKNIKLSEYLAATELRLTNLESKPNLSNSQLVRLKAFLGKVVFPCWISTRGVDPRCTNVVVRELRDTHGWQSHVCQGQFDICAAKMARENKEVIVVSTDSDLMFTGIKELVRFQTKGTQFYSYPIKKIQNYCGLKTDNEWVSAAVLSLNDYDTSVGRTSFKTAIDDIKSIRDSWSRKTADRSTEGFVKEQCRRKNVDYSSVKNSIESFVNLQETPLEDYRQGDDEIDDSIRRIVYRVEALTLL